MLVALHLHFLAIACRRHYFNNTDGLIFVVDSADRDRIGRAAQEFKSIIEDPLMKTASLLVFANKQVWAAALGQACMGHFRLSMAAVHVCTCNQRSLSVAEVQHGWPAYFYCTPYVVRPWALWWCRVQTFRWGLKSFRLFGY